MENRSYTQAKEVLLYYKYMNITDPEVLKQEQLELCRDLDLKGRIIVSKEGINGTLEGLRENTNTYRKHMLADKRFTDMHFKTSPGSDAADAFPKLSIKVRQEIVSAHLGERDVNPNKITGKYISAEELHSWLTEGKKEFYIVDMRNDYEHKVGYFEGSILAPLSNFRDLPEAIEELAHLRGETVVTVCTGGVRCEKASGFLVDNGFSDVYQLYGGIHTYMEKYPNEHFKGKLYVFDGRITIGFNGDDDSEVVSKCDKCGDSSDRYVDCAYLHCSNENRHFICCENCLDVDGRAFCNEQCQDLEMERLAARI